MSYGVRYAVSGRLCALLYSLANRLRLWDYLVHGVLFTPVQVSAEPNHVIRRAGCSRALQGRIRYSEEARQKLVAHVAGFLSLRCYLAGRPGGSVITLQAH